jgi:hypothetical protein
MPNRRHDPPTPWIREREPWVPEPTPTGRAVLRLWIDSSCAWSASPTGDAGSAGAAVGKADGQAVASLSDGSHALGRKTASR